MSFRGELHSNPKLVLGLTESGQGKATGAATLLPYLGEVPILRPSDGLSLTRAIWNVGHRQYLQNGVPGPHQEAYDAKRAAGVPEWKIKLANLELVRALEGSDTHLVSMHGLFGYGAERTVVELDRKVEASLAAPRTRALVPLHETADELFAIGQENGLEQDIEVVGFMVPDALKDSVRKQKRIETLSQSEPSRDNPLRLAFMTTGQFAHQDMLKEQILGDELVQRWIKEGRMKMDIYMWDGEQQAVDVKHFAEDKGLSTVVTDSYEPNADYDVQIIYNKDPLTAVQHSIQIASEADIVASAIAERVGWTLEVPFIALPPVGSNAKMLSNMDWAATNGLTMPLKRGQTIGTLLPEFFGNGDSNVRKFYDKAEQSKSNFAFDITSGAQKAAELILDRLYL